MWLCPRDYLSRWNKCKYDSEDSNFEDCLLNFLIHEYDA